MKINWGTGIAIFYSLFVIILLSAVFRSRHFDHSLVSDHYYADDQNYQRHYEKLVNANALEEDLKIWNKRQKDLVTLEFPKDLIGIGGEIYFFCPSDSKQDFKINIQPDEGNAQYVSTEGLKKGLWKVKVDWKTDDNKSFYKEEIINL